MAKFINTTGEPTLGIALCSRCQRKRRLSDLVSDGNIPKFMVCKPELSPGCWDKYDPLRLPPRAPDKYVLPYVRPDQDIAMSDAAQAEAGLPILPPPPDAEHVVVYRITEEGAPRVTEQDALRILWDYPDV